MRGSSGWEVAGGAARMIRGNTEGQPGSGKGKGRERGNKITQFCLVSEKSPVASHHTEVLCEMVLWHVRDSSQVPRVQGHRTSPVPVGDRLVVTARLDMGVCIDPCLSQPSSHDAGC